MGFGSLVSGGGFASQGYTAQAQANQGMAANQLAMSQTFQKMRDDEAMRNAGQAAVGAYQPYQPSAAPNVMRTETTARQAGVPGAAAPAPRVGGTPRAPTQAQQNSPEGAQLYRQRLEDVTGQIKTLEAAPAAGAAPYAYGSGQYDYPFHEVGQPEQQFSGVNPLTYSSDAAAAQQRPDAARLADLKQQQSAYQRGLAESTRMIPGQQGSAPAVQGGAPTQQAPTQQQAPGIQGVLYSLQGTPQGEQMRMVEYQLEQAQRQMQAMAPYANNPQVAQQILALQGQATQMQVGKMKMMSDAAISQFAFSGDPTAALQAMAMQGVNIGMQRTPDGRVVLVDGQGQATSAPLYPAQMADYLRRMSDAKQNAALQKHQQAMQLEMLKQRGAANVAQIRNEGGVAAAQARPYNLGTMETADGAKSPVAVVGGQPTVFQPGGTVALPGGPAVQTAPRAVPLQMQRAPAASANPVGQQGVYFGAAEGEY